MRRQLPINRRIYETDFQQRSGNGTQFDINDFYEDLNSSNTSLNAVYHCAVDAETVFPNYAELASMEFETVKIINSDNVVIPQNHVYTSIRNVSITYNETSKIYNVNIILE